MGIGRLCGVLILEEEKNKKWAYIEFIRDYSRKYSC
jgi:hypothetical protein